MREDKSGQQYFNEGRVLVWVSCGAASAVAAKLSLEKYGKQNTQFIYCDVSNDEDEDNQRFLRDLEQWLSIKVQTLKSGESAKLDKTHTCNSCLSGSVSIRVHPWLK